MLQLLPAQIEVYLFEKKTLCKMVLLVIKDTILSVYSDISTLLSALLLQFYSF